MTSHLEAISSEQQRAIVQFGPFVKRRAMYLTDWDAMKDAIRKWVKKIAG